MDEKEVKQTLIDYFELYIEHDKPCPLGDNMFISVEILKKFKTRNWKDIWGIPIKDRTK